MSLNLGLMSNDVFIVVGPTASGKTDFAISLAQKITGEIITCDSTTIYQGFDVGTSKPTVYERKLVPHHLIDVCHWSEKFDAGKYSDLAQKKIAEILLGKKKVIIAGGTGLYLRALLGENFHDLPSDLELRKTLDQFSNESLIEKLQGLDPKRASEIHARDRYRLLRAVEICVLTGKTLAQAASDRTHQQKPWKLFLIYLDPFLCDAKENVISRTQAMLKSGFVEEVESLRLEGCPVAQKVMQSVGYREVNLFLDGFISAAALPEKISQATNQYARRQRTWFSSMRADLHLVGTRQNGLNFLKNCPYF